MTWPHHHLMMGPLNGGENYQPMTESFFHSRVAQLSQRLASLTPSIELARQSVQRLEAEQVPAGAVAGARAARLSAARAMVATLEERARQVRIAINALQAELETD
ncbi:MAG: hypothetical protein RMK84_02700 [Oscillochloridaceae bacterium]|nr:hypothetical protein [Chloroflexaceae bacterium]MDW8389013.1 hypothetical protein [Oscillochloridaceae bacterium]